MGESILAQVLDQLRLIHIASEKAYPGRKHSAIDETVAAVHIHRVDTAERTVTLAISILCPATMGGTACEVKAMEATAALQSIGGVCVQSGCEYDGLARAYCVEILATFYGDIQAEDCTLGEGFQVLMDDNILPYAQSFTGEKLVNWENRYCIGEAEVVATIPGNVVWKITLEERIPFDYQENIRCDDTFVLRVAHLTGVVETYRGCYWTSVKRQFTSTGIYRLRTGYAQSMEEAE